MVKGIFVLGDSHIAAMKTAASKVKDIEQLPIKFLPFGPGSVTPQPFYKTKQNMIEVNARKWNKRTFPLQPEHLENPSDYIYAACLPLNTSRFLRDYNWGLYTHWSMEAGPNQIPLSDAVIEQIVEGDAKNAIGFVKALKELGLNTVVIDSPWYFQHASIVKNTSENLASLLSRIYKNYVSAQIEAAGIPIIWQPPATRTELDACLPKYRSENPDDEIHANHVLGAVMLSKFLNFAMPLGWNRHRQVNQKLN